MASLTAPLKLFRRGDSAFNPLIPPVPVKASTYIAEGAIVAIDSSGNALPAGLTASGTVRIVGVAEATADNSTGIAGAISVIVRRGCFSYANDTAGNACVAANVGAQVYAHDDHTISNNSITSTIALCGVFVGFDNDVSGNVLVEIGTHAIS